MSRPVDYLATLEAAWRDHLAPRTVDAPTVISTFAGGGGSSLGYSMAGFRELLAVEWDANAVETLRLNFPGLPIYHGDIAKLSVEKCLEMAGIAPRELDVLDGSPPCQGFSTAGKRNLDDPRNSLFREYVRLLRGLHPKVFVMENVSGMVKGKMKLVFAEILRELKASGYRVKARLLNAMYYGVPQSRQRMIFVGVRGDIEVEPGHPKAQAQLIPMDHVLPIKTARYDTHGTFTKKIFKPNLEPLATITKGNRHHMPIRIGDSPERYLTSAEGQLFSSFPPAFRFAGANDPAWGRIGNSVPPLLIRAIARHIRTEILAMASAARGAA